ncbi:unnamed protein product [Caenorhabditis bovis]|uniref:HORMA domain-containing protein n=1 Tax=Caenorhabditis bovis TaxID=2654633 RepID=A0A8S1FDW4_9PELO|nr:unnamed protein product [Caenorhabditis bovis]
MVAATAVNNTSIPTPGVDSNDFIHDKKWASCFPQSLADEQSSLKFMTRAMYVAFSCVLRYRKLFAEDFFKMTMITEKLKIRALSFENPDASRIAFLIRSAAEGIKEGVLEEFALVISSKKEEEEALEVFSWKMHYDAFNNPTATFTQGREEPNSPLTQLAQLKYEGSTSVRDQLVLLVRSIQVICQKVLSELPKDVSMNFRVSYLPHVRPDYQIEGFRDSSYFYSVPEDCQSASLGHLRPGHHGCYVSCSSMFIADSFTAETTLKKYTDKFADQLGYERSSGLYQSFMSADDPNVTNASLLVAAPTESSQSPNDEANASIDAAEKLAKKIDSVNISDKGKKNKRKQATIDENNTSPTRRSMRFARVVSCSKESPTKRSKE